MSFIIHRFADSNRRAPPRIWLDIGTREGGRIVQDVESSCSVLEKGWHLATTSYERVDGARNEPALGPFLHSCIPARDRCI